MSLFFLLFSYPQRASTQIFLITENICLDQCSLSKDEGICPGNVPRFYFDHSAQRCLLFSYGGCGGNINNFVTEKACINSCGGPTGALLHAIQLHGRIYSYFWSAGGFFNCEFLGWSIRYEIEKPKFVFCSGWEIFDLYTPKSGKKLNINEKIFFLLWNIYPECSLIHHQFL